MAKWVTFYRSIVNGNVDLVEHKDKKNGKRIFFKSL